MDEVLNPGVLDIDWTVYGLITIDEMVGSSISPDLWIGIIIECFHGFRNTFVTIDVLIINVIYGIVTIRLSSTC